MRATELLETNIESHLQINMNSYKRYLGKVLQNSYIQSYKEMPGCLSQT